METAPPWFEEAALKNLVIVSLDDHRPALDRDESRSVVEALLDRDRPDIVIFDSLRFLFPSLEENDSNSMSRALDVIGELAGRYKFATILVHHHGKGDSPRGSSVLEGWPRAQLELKLAGDDDEAVEVRGRYSYQPDPGAIYWTRPTLNAPWFELADPATYAAGTKKTGRPRKVPGPEAVRDLLQGEIERSGRMSLESAQLVKLAKEAFKAKERTAQQAVKDARDAGSILLAAGRYVPIDDPEPAE